jgi:Beta-1,3-glucanase/Malectin domain/Putative Ig domain
MHPALPHRLVARVRRVLVLAVGPLLLAGLLLPGDAPPAAAAAGVDISAGGPAVAPFAADEHFTGGASAATTHAITITGLTNPAPQSVYQHNRYGNFTYIIPGLTAGASYTVRLHFAEEYWTATGSRIFNVLINGIQVLTNFDIFAVAGGEYIGVIEQFAATASSTGTVTIQFATVKDNAQVNGIEVTSSGGSTVTVTSPGNQSGTAGTAASLQVSASDSASGQTLTYTATGLPAGLSINSATGLITGTPITVGTSTVTVTATDTTGAAGTATFAWTVSSGSGSGTFPVTFQNNTRGTWSNAQIYVLVLGQAVPGQWSYLKPDGTLAHINHLDASAPGHLTKNGVNYPNMSFTLAQAPTVTIPARLEGARIYISVGSPMYIAVSPDDQGWAGPDLSNPADPNIDVYFDWYEFTYQFGVTAFGGNTTQVDMFGFPVTARLQQTAIGYDQTVGITLTRAQVMAQYAAAAGSAFQPLAGTYRIVAPRSSALFQPGGAQATYLQSYINQTWAYYTANQFTLTRLNQTFTGRVSGNTLTFTKDGTGPFVLNKPTTADVMACSGALASAGMSTTALELGAEFCAAFNRGVALNTAEWYNPAAYYTGAIKNDYAGFFHTISLNHLAYGFAYDDINDQSSVQILPNANPPSSLTIGVGW